LNFQPSGSGKHLLQAETDDLGAVLRTLGISDNVRGGRLEVTGETGSSALGAPLRAHVEATDYGLAKQSWVLRVLTMASARGFISAPTSHVICFRHLVSDFVIEGDVVTIKDLRSHGSSLGLTVEGKIDLAKATINLEGTVVPVYTAHRIVKSVPLLRGLWKAVKAEEYLAVAYDVEGNLKEPSIHVNPLRSLEPAFVRKLFELAE
jgi:hypothetical protein